MGGDSRLFPPTLDGTNYAVWKVRVEAYTMGKKHEVWSMMVKGVDTEYEKFSKEELEFNGSAKNIIFASISDNLFHQVSSCSKAKEMWDKLKTTHEGTQQQKDNQVGILVNDFELFRQKTGESIRDLVGRMNALINALKNMGKEYSTLELNRKLLNALSSEWKIKVIAIEEAKNLTTAPLDEIVGSLLTHEMNEARRNEGTIKKDKSIALQAQESSSDDDEDVALLSRKIARMLRGRRKFGNTSKVCYECRKPGHFKDECPNLRKKEENEKMKKKPTWRGDKKKKAFKATWSDSSEGEDNEEGGEASEEVNLCLMANSSEGEVSVDDISNDELSDALADLLCTYRVTRRELKRSRQENLQLVEQISLLVGRLEEASSFPTKENEHIRKLGEENSRLEMEITKLKEKQNVLVGDRAHKEEKTSLQGEYILLRERYDRLLGSQKALEMLLGSQRSALRKEGLGYIPDDMTRSTVGTKWVKEGTENPFKSPEPQDVSTTVDIKRKKGFRNYLVDETMKRDPRYRYSHSFGMLGEHRMVEKLVDSRVEHSRVTYSNSVPMYSRLRPVCSVDNVAYHREVPRAPTSQGRVLDLGLYRTNPRAHMQYHHMAEYPSFYHPHIHSPHFTPLTPFELVNIILRFRLPQYSPRAPMEWN